jgi:hypothetical protein
MITVQAGCPTMVVPATLEQPSLRSAMAQIFDHPTEWLFIGWSGVFIPIRYQDQLYPILVDVAGAIDLMARRRIGQSNVDIVENDLAFGWRLRWDFDQLDIDSSWHLVPSGLEAILNGRATIRTTVGSFAAEWKKPMRTVIDAIEGAGVVISDQPGMFDLVRRIEASVPNSGWLYERGSKPS